METGSILDRERSGTLSIGGETINAVRVAFHRNPRKSIRVASNELAIPRSTVHKVLHKRLRLHACKLQIQKAFGRVPRKVIKWAMRKKRFTGSNCKSGNEPQSRGKNKSLNGI